MWYFAWILGVGLAVAFGVLNGIWHEFHLFDEGDLGLAEEDRDDGRGLVGLNAKETALPSA